MKSIWASLRAKFAYNDALHHYRISRSEIADERAQAVLRIDPDHQGALWISGLLAIDAKDFDGASTRFERLSTLDHTNPEVWLSLGNVHRERGQLEESACAYRRALKCDTRCARAHGNLGAVMNELGNHKAAIDCHRQAIALDGTLSRDHFNLAVAHRDAGDLRAAADCYRAALAIDTEFAEAHHNLGAILRDLGDRDGAIASFREALKADPQHASAKHLLASLTGSTNSMPPIDYVTNLFDNFAPRFDDHMLHKLAYTTPQHCRAVVGRLRSAGENFANAIDLGCGTGLSGERFRDIADFLCGIDVSPKMIAMARKKKIYDATEVAEACDFLEATPQKFELFIAADVVVYFGDLSRLLRGIGAAASPRALVVFSTEKHDGTGYVLRDTGRYAHAPPDVIAWSQEAGFTVLAHEKATIRTQNGEPVIGLVYALRFEGG